jgi:hypothetical protein
LGYKYHNPDVFENPVVWWILYAGHSNSSDRDGECSREVGTKVGLRKGCPMWRLGVAVVLARC